MSVERLEPVETTQPPAGGCQLCRDSQCFDAVGDPGDQFPPTPPGQLFPSGRADSHVVRINPIEGKLVEETFVRVSPRRRRPGTSSHSRTSVPRRGWIAAGLLNVGDKLHTLEGERLAARFVEDSGEVKTVYNFRGEPDGLPRTRSRHI